MDVRLWMSTTSGWPDPLLAAVKDGMVRLAGCYEARRPSSVSSRDTSRESFPEVDETKLVVKPKPFEDIPLLLGKTQCVYCVGDERLF
ncbi:hypothetical protein MY8738_006396 [Beauveria namnaoensis]